MQDTRRQGRHKRWLGRWLAVGLSGLLLWGPGSMGTARDTYTQQCKCSGPSERCRHFASLETSVLSRACLTHCVS